MKKNSFTLLMIMLAIPLTLSAASMKKLIVEAHRNDYPEPTRVQAERFVIVEEIKEEVQPTIEEQEEPILESLSEFKLTAYCSCSKCCGDWANNRPTDEHGNEIVIGSTGAVLQAGLSIAVDKNVIPYGSVVLINGKEYIAHDCGGAIKGNRIDVYFDDHQKALEFGVQYAEVFILRGDTNGI